MVSTSSVVMLSTSKCRSSRSPINVNYKKLRKKMRPEVRANYILNEVSGSEGVLRLLPILIKMAISRSRSSMTSKCTNAGSARTLTST